MSAHNDLSETERAVGYLAGLIAIVVVVFGWPYWPIAWIVIALLLIADFVLET